MLSISIYWITLAVAILKMRPEKVAVIINERLIAPFKNIDNYVAFGVVGILLLTITTVSYININRSAKIKHTAEKNREEKQQIKSLLYLTEDREKCTTQFANNKVFENKELKKEIAKLKEEMKELKLQINKKESSNNPGTNKKSPSITINSFRNKRIKRALEDAERTR